MNSRTRTLIYGGSIRTQSPGYPTVAAMVTEGDRIIGIGDLEDMQDLAGKQAAKIDVRGATVMPGLIDTHRHLLHFSVLGAPLVPLFGVQSHAEIVERIRERARQVPPGEWILTTPVGHGDDDYFAREPDRYKSLVEGVLPDRKVLDEATPDHPVAILAFPPVIPNTAAFNSMALAKVGLNRDTPARVSNVWIEKDAEGEPTGLIRGSVNFYYAEDSFNDTIWQQVPTIQAVGALDAVKAGIAQAAMYGVTTILENHMLMPEQVELYRALRQSNELNLRVMAAMELDDFGFATSKPRSEPEIVELLEHAKANLDFEDEFFRFSGVSVMWDGVCNPGWMMMSQAYPGPYGELTKGHYQTSPEKIRLAMDYCLEHDVPLNSCAMGDKAIEENLEMAEADADKAKKAPNGWVLVHGFFLRPELINRYAALNYNYTTTMTAVWGKGDLYARRFGEACLDHLCPLRNVFDSGMDVGGGTDWAPRNLWKHVEISLTHEFFESGKSNLGARQKISRDEALSMFTDSAAKVMGWAEIGSLQAGNYADYVVLDRDPGTCPIEDLAGTKVMRTVLAGNIAYDSGEIA